MHIRHKEIQREQRLARALLGIRHMPKTLVQHCGTVVALLWRWRMVVRNPANHWEDQMAAKP
ncbi:MAG TPA: hypothetical protein VKV32_15805, partial [Stellaceae bacterium]|nr:hypothetical protein [Stellaceae bacterium]